MAPGPKPTELSESGLGLFERYQGTVLKFKHGLSILLVQVFTQIPRSPIYFSKLQCLILLYHCSDVSCHSQMDISSVAAVHSEFCSGLEFEKSRAVQ